MSYAFWFTEPVYLVYLRIWVGLLVVGGLILGVLRLILGRSNPVVASALVTYRSWWMILPLLAVPLGWGREPTIVFFTVLSIWCFKEFARATGLYRDWIFTGTVYLAIVFLNCLALVRWYGMFLVWPAYVTAGLFMIPVLRNRTEGMIQTTCLSIVGFLYFGWFLGHLSYLANAEHGLAYLLFLTLAVGLNDIFAFTFGKLFGRRPLAPKVSPKKTWEGSIGCVLATAAVVWALRSTLPHFGPVQLMLSALIVGVGGQFGDLVISVIKRDVGVKDLGAVLPGHGGWLDRFDSLIFVSPLFFHMAAYFFLIQ